MLKYCLAAAAAAAGVASPVHAQDAQPAADKATTGFRVEAITGYEDASFDSVRGDSGFLYGIGAGYDIAAGRFRLGIEGEASDSTARECTVFVGNSVCSKAGRDLYAGARVGGMISDNVLLYGKVGYTNFRQSNRLTPVGGGATLVLHPESDGLRLGAGTEMALGAKTFIKAEYRFSNYEASDNFDRHQGVIGFGLRF
ncbi:MAG TPA: porin family protein [Allosphingosinicella sp.]|jgi:outer membrane immunogenic protein